MRGKGFKWLAGLAGVIAVATLATWLCLRGRPPAAPVPTVSEPSAKATIHQPGDSGAPALAKPQLDQTLPGAAAQLAKTRDLAARKKALEELRQSLATGTTNEISAAIRRFLDSRMDAPTGEGFKVGGRGVLKEAPTLRTYLLDYLGQIDPAAAAEYARVILDSKDSPDEWAVALRNLARGDSRPDARALLEQKITEMLQYEPWQQNPSAGYLEAFDTEVYLGGASLIPTLTDLIQQQDNPAVAHASYLALDRLVINNPTVTLTALLADPGLMQGREQTRADYFARADVRDPRQRELVENYLLNPQISPAELQQFAGVFPNANYMISQNLLTATPTPDAASLTSRDAESLLVVQQWLADPRFAPVRPQLEKISSRLGEFVRQEQAK